MTAALLIFFADSALAQNFSKSVDFQIQQIANEPQGPAKLAKIDAVLLKVVEGKFEKQDQVLQLIGLRAEYCKKTPAKCSNIATWLVGFCREASNALNPKQLASFWEHIGSVTKTPAGYSEVLNQFKANCSQKQSSVAFRRAMEFRTEIAGSDRSRLTPAQAWILQAFTEPAPPFDPPLLMLEGAYNKAYSSDPQQIEDVKFVAQLGANWVLSGRFSKDKNSALRVLKMFTLPGLWEVSHSADIAKLADSSPLKEEIEARSGEAASLVDVFCDAWQKTGQAARCDDFLKGLLGKTWPGDAKRRLNIASIQQHYWNGRLVEADKAIKALLSEFKDVNDMSGSFIHFLSIVIEQDLGKYPEALAHLDQRYALMDKTFARSTVLKMVWDNLRVNILTKQKKFPEAKALSDQVVADLEKRVRGANELGAMITYNRFKLMTMMGEKKEAAATGNRLKAMIKELPGLAFMGDLVDYLSAPGAGGDAALKRATKILGNDNPWIKELSLFKAG